MRLMQVAINMVLKKSERRSTLVGLCKAQIGYWAYTSMFVFIKWNVNTWDEYYLSYTYFPTIHFF